MAKKYDYDVMFEVWRRGGNADAVDWERCRGYREMDYPEDVAAECELLRQTVMPPEGE